MSTQTPTIRDRSSARSDIPPMWLRPSGGTNPNHEDDMPYVGEVRMFGGALPPLWIPLGSPPVSRTTFAALFGVIGTTWGVGDGSTTFDVPPSQRVPIAAGTTPPLSDRVLGDLGGDETVTLAGNQCGLQGGIGLTVDDPGHLHGLGTIADAGHLHGVGTIAATVNDPEHVHAASAGEFLYVSNADIFYSDAGANTGTSSPNTAAAATGITVDIAGDTAGATADLTGDTSSEVTAITVTTPDTDAIDPTPIMSPFAVFNFGIFANA